MSNYNNHLDNNLNVRNFDRKVVNTDMKILTDDVNEDNVIRIVVEPTLHKKVTVLDILVILIRRKEKMITVLDFINPLPEDRSIIMKSGFMSL